MHPPSPQKHSPLSFISPTAMPRLSQEFPNHHNCSNFDAPNLINFSRNHTGIHGGAPNMINFSKNHTGIHGGIEFRAHREHESGVTSPPLWHSSPPKSPPTETTPLQAQAYNHPHYRSLSPTSRLQAITRGKAELMEMVKNMPESSYELSLKDLVDHSKIHGAGQTTLTEEKELDKAFNSGIKDGKKKKKRKKKLDQAQMSRSGSTNANGPFLLKMFFPIIWTSNKKKQSSTTDAKVSPKPIEGEKFGDRDWWRKRGIGETDSNGSGGSSNSSRSRNMGYFLPGCWSFFNRKSKIKEQKGTLF